MNTHQPKKLYRSGSERIIAGVAGGLAKYFDIDPVIMRLAFVLLAFANGLGLVAYILLWIVVPSENGEVVKFNNPGRSGRKMFGGLLIIVGLLVLLNQIFPMRFFPWHLFWPVVLIILGFYFATSASRPKAHHQPDHQKDHQENHKKHIAVEIKEEVKKEESKPEPEKVSEEPPKSQPE